MYRFHDQKVDTDLFLQLQDLACVLSQDPDFTFEFSYGSFIDVIDKKVTVSTFWDTANTEAKEAGYKTDLYLRTVGTLHYSAVQEMKQFLEDIKENSLPKFAVQLFTLLEDLRLEETVKQERPGTKKNFSTRKAYQKRYFTSQLASNVTRSMKLDELFCLIYLLIQADGPDPSFPRANPKQLEKLDALKPVLYSVFEANHTRDIVKLTNQIVLQLEPDYGDMINEYFIFPISHIEKVREDKLFDELTRTDPLANDDKEDVRDQDEFIDQRFSTWHRENKNEDRKQLFLQFELEQGTKTSIMGGGARETEEGDQAMASIQGTSGESKQKDYSKQNTLSKKEESQSKQGSESEYGEENKDAVILTKKAETPSAEAIHLYREYVHEIEPLKRKLEKTIEKTIEHKKNQPRSNLVFGRLSKALLPIVIDDNPRVFYKKDHESKEFDAVFTLLVDCSASMHNKMDETKKGIILFHEVLKSLRIPHSIIGFWEDAMEVKEHYQPNYFHKIHSFSDSFYENNGAKIMQLEPEEDNRDGFSIRLAAKELEERREKNKFLLVFSDGEPAAANYNQNGIIDTHEAVTETRKKGIEVIGNFIADGEISEQQDELMKNIYGRERVMIPDVSELPGHFAPLLKRLLLKML